MVVDAPSSPIPLSIAETDHQAPDLPPLPSVNLALQEENNFSPNPSPTRDSSPADFQLQSSSRRELDVCIFHFVLQRRSKICFIQSMRNSISTLIETVNQLRHPSFTQDQIELLLPTIVSQLNELIGNSKRVEAIVEKLQVTVEALKVTTARTDNSVQEHTSAIAGMKAQLSAHQASQDTHWSEFQKELETFRKLLIPHMPRDPSTDVVVDGIHASDKGQPKDIDTPTVATTSEHLNVSIVTREDHSSDVVVHTTPATQISHAGPDDSRRQSPTETTVGPISREQAVTQPMQDICLPTEIEQAVTQPMQDISLPTEIEQAVAEPIQDPGLSASPPSKTISQDTYGQDAVNTDK